MAASLGADEDKNGGGSMKVPSISVIIPAYNYGQYLSDALNSVAEQTLSDWECIVVDDGSTDDTRSLVEAFIAQHPALQFRYVHTPNAGTSAAKNIGIDLAWGRYLQFLDADDLLSPDKLAIHAAIIESTDAALVFSKAVFFRDGATPVLIDHYPKGFLAEHSLEGAALLSALIKNNLITISSPLVHKDLLIRAGKFQTDLKNNEDWLLWFKIALLKPKFIFDGDNRSCVKIRVHGNSAMRNQLNMYLGEVVVRETMASELQTSVACPDREALRRKNLDLLALHRVRSLDWKTGWGYIAQELIRHPLQRGPLLVQGLLRSLVRTYRKIVPNHGT